MFSISAKALATVVCCLVIYVAKAADTLKISIRQADSTFVTGNYKLLAASMNVSAEKARIIQAKVYPNPVFTADFNAWDPGNQKAFHVDQSGQKSFQFEQLILLGGKRKTQIEMAKTNAAIAELEFQDMVRQLKFQLHSSLHFLSRQKFLIEKYNKQLHLLDTILVAYETQVNKGNIPLKDLVRLKGVYLNLNNDRSEIIKTYLEEEQKVQTILQTDQIVDPIIPESEITKLIKDISLNDLLTTALGSRTDYLAVQQNKLFAQQYLKYQKSQAVPDLNFITSYDQRGGAFNNQINAGFAIALPVWDRNRGNIKAARYQIKQNEYDELGMKTSITAEVSNSYALYNQTVSEYKKATGMFNDDFETTLKGMSDNFKKRNISLIEFVDFFESYNNVIAETVRIKIQLAVSAEQLNYSVGKELY